MDGEPKPPVREEPEGDEARVESGVK